MDTFVYVPHTRSSNIAATLGNINSSFTALDSHIKLGMSITNNDIPKIIGMTVSTFTFPTLNVTSGKLVLADGTVYSYNAGTIAIGTTPSTTYYIYVTSGFVLATGTTVPGSAILVLATVTTNGGGTDFAVLDQGVTKEEMTYNGSNQLIKLEHKSGPLVLKTWDYTYSAGKIATLVETSDTYVTTRTYNYDGNSNLIEVVVSSVPYRFRGFN